MTDGLGDRQLAFDPVAATSIEVLHLKAEFGDSPEFEASLRGRVEDVKACHHPSLAAIHAVERIERRGLSLVSKHTPGRRLSELVEKAHGPAFALELIRLVTPALATLHRVSGGIAHGLLTPERIIATRDGRLVVVEHVFGSAIEALKLPRQRLIDLGAVVADGDGPVRFDGRTDMTQLGFIALSLLVGRRLDPSDYPGKMPELLDEFVKGAGSPVLAAKMRVWLERAMQMSTRSFASAREAADALGQLPDDVTVRAAEAVRTRSALPSTGAVSPVLSPRPPLHKIPDVKPVEHVSAPPIAEPVMAPPPAPARRGFSRAAVWIMAALALVAVGEGVVLFVRPYLLPAADVIEVRSPSVEAAGALAAAAALPSPTPTPEPAGEVMVTGDAAAAPAGSTGSVAAPGGETAPPAAETLAPPAAAGPRFGGVTVSSTIELQVLEDGTLVGSTAGPIAVNEGSHNLDFVNEALGFRYRQFVNVKGGQMTSVKIAVPNGRLSINAVPWAEVTIDGTLAGETPLANLSLPIGAHEIVFRHPELGERKQTAIVKVDGIVRITQTFQQNFKP